MSVIPSDAAAVQPDSYAHGASTRGAGRRVLHVATRHLGGGAERNLAHFVDWEFAAGYEVEVALGRDSNAGGFPAGVRIHSIQSLVRNPHPLKDLVALRELRSLIRSGHYDMVHTHHSKAGILGRLAARGTTRKIVHTVHMASFGPGYRSGLSLAFRQAERYCASFSDAIAFVGSELRDQYLRAGIGQSARTVVIHSPIEVERFAATRAWGDSERSAVRRRFGIDGARLALAVGALEPRKRYELMIGQLEPLLRTGELNLAIAGEGKSRHGVERGLRRRGLTRRVHVLGHVSAISDLMAAADLLVHTSSVEGVPQVVIQALAAGKPVVAADVTGLREIPGESVTVLPPSADGLASAVAAWLSDPPAQANLQALAAWRCDAIDGEIRAFHERFDA